MSPVLTYVALTVFGLCLGSFVNALIWRLHEQEIVKSKKQTKATKNELEELSIVRGRSMCSHCHHQLAPKDLVPVASWIMLRGKCRYCHQKIQDTPVAEILTVFLFIVSYFFWPHLFHGYGLIAFYFWLVFMVGFVALAVYDLRWHILPDRIVFPLVGFALLEVIIHVLFFNGGFSALTSSFWGVLIASGFFFVLFQVSDGSWIGGGDVKLGLVLGILIGGPLRSGLLLFFSSALGTILSLPLLIAGRVKRNAQIPYGPFLLAAAVIVQLFGGQLTSWFNGFFVR